MNYIFFSKIDSVYHAIPSSAVVKFAANVGTPSLMVKANTVIVYVVYFFKL